MEIFLTFLIVTYRRPEKVARLLKLFLDEQWHQLDHLKFEIVIADDHGEDTTRETINPIIRSLIERGWLVRYVYREENLRGDRNLYYGYARDSSGKFVWFLCDDDVLDVGRAISYIGAVRQWNPLVGICGFTQGSANEYGNRLGNEVRLVQDFQEAVDYLIRFPKTTAYLLRRCPEVNLDNVFERWDRTLYSWIGISIFLLATKKGGAVLIYPEIVATADDDYKLLRYSFRIFRNLYSVTKDSVEVSGMLFGKIESYLANLSRLDELNLCLTGLYAHFSWRSPIKYAPDVLKEELTFVKDNWPSIFRSRQRLMSFMKLVFFFISSHAVYR